MAPSHAVPKMPAGPIAVIASAIAPVWSNTGADMALTPGTVDAVTLSPFMGFDSVAPYRAYRDKGALLLCRTSNPGGADLLQGQRLASVPGQPLLYEHVATLAQGPWNLNGQLGLVVGATYPCLYPQLIGPRLSLPRT